MDVLELPGGHVGCVAQPAQFGSELTDALPEPATAGD
jgi:hypothetical protein